MLDRGHFERLDREDPLAPMRDRFLLPAGVVYLEGHSLGPLPGHVPAVVSEVVEAEWGRDLITSWNRNGWWTLPGRVGERIAPLIGAAPGTVIAGDSTTVALYKTAGAARRLRPDRDVILSDSGNFPTDLYALSSVAAAGDARLVMVEPEGVMDRIRPDVALVALTHVDYRSGRRHPMPEITEQCHRAGAVVLWDLSHSAGVMDIDVSDADLAVGCGYKHLNGGPGAPAFVYVHPRHHDSVHNPIAGWWGHADPFAMRPDFEATTGIGRLQVGTQPILSMAALHAALEVFDGVHMRVVRAKSERLVADFISLVDDMVPEFEVRTPRSPGERGSHVSLAHPSATPVMAALVARGVIGDVRPPDLCRFGFGPLYQRHVDVWEAVKALRAVLDEGTWPKVPVVTGPVT